VLNPGDAVEIIMSNTGSEWSAAMAFTDGFAVVVPANPEHRPTATSLRRRRTVNSPSVAGRPSWAGRF
jgi:hypothetical protein